MYAVSKDRGETFTKVNGSEIPLPMTSATADLVFHTDIPIIYNLNHIAVDFYGNPLIAWTEMTDRIENKWSWWNKDTQVWQDPILNPTGGWLGRVLLNPKGMLTLIAEEHIFRTRDWGKTGERYSIPDMSITRTKFDYKYFQETENIRLFIQSENDGSGSSTIRVLTLDFS